MVVLGGGRFLISKVPLYQMQTGVRIPLSVSPWGFALSSSLSLPTSSTLNYRVKQLLMQDAHS